MKRLFAITLAISLVASAPLFALDRYIDPVNGNNSNSGTSEGDAWKTITYAVEELDNAGGTLENPVSLHLAAGTYDINSGETYPIQVPVGIGYVVFVGVGQNTIIDGTGGGDDGFQIDEYNAYYAFVMDYYSVGIELNYMKFQYFEGILGAYYVDDRIKITYVEADNFVDFEGNNDDGSDLDEIDDPDNIDDIDDCDIWQSAIGVRWGSAQIVLENVNIDGAFTPGSGGALFVNECQGDVQILNSTFTDSKANYYGGALCIMNGGLTTIENVVIEDSQSEWRSGGGIAILNMGGEVHINNLEINDCEAYLAGGGLALLQVTVDENVFNNISVEDCEVANGHGGGIYMSGIADDTITLNGLSLCNNTAENGHGGGMYCGSPILGWGTVTIDSFTVLGNTAGYYGGGLFLSYFDNELTNGTVYQNISDGHGNGNSGGGGVYVERSWLNFFGISLKIDDVIFWGNEAYGYGGGLYIHDYSNNWSYLRGLEIKNAVFLDNITHHADGGGAFIRAGHATQGNANNIIKNVLFAGNHADKKGGALYCKFANPDLVNVTMTENTADQNFPSFRYQRKSYNMEVYNSIIWGNGDLGDGTETTYGDASRIDFYYSNVESDGGNVVSGEGNVNSNPLFVSPGDQVFYPFPGSLMYDAGMPLDPDDPHPYADYSHEPSADVIDTVFWGDGPEDYIVVELNNRVDMGYSYTIIDGAGPDCEHCGVNIRLPEFVYNDPGSGGGTGGGTGTADIPPNPNPYLPSKLVVRDDYFFLGIPVLPNTDLYQEQPRVSFGDDLNNTTPGGWTLDPYTQSWRVSRWVNRYPDAGSPTGFYRGYLRYLEEENNGREIGDPPPLTPGLGFWFVYNYAASEEDMLWIDVLKHMLEPIPHVLPLESAYDGQPALNMMANPWPFPIDWTQVEIKNITTDSDWLTVGAAADANWINRYAYAWNSYERDYFEVTGRLDSWQGFFLMVLTEDSLNVRFQPEQVSQSMPQMTGLNELDDVLDWSLLMTARRTDALQVDYHNWIGVGASISDTIDAFDAYQLVPMAKEAIFMRTRPRDSEGNYPDQKLSYDFRSNEYDNNGNKAWFGEIWFYSSSDNGPAYPIDVKVQWPTISNIPDDVTIGIYEFNSGTFDPANDAVIIPDLRAQSNHVFTVDNPYGSQYMYTRYWIVASTGTEPDVAVDDISSLIPLETRLAEAYPNPFNSTTNIRFELHEAANVNLKIFNVMGQQVSDLANMSNYRAGYHQIPWNAHDQASGIYFVQFTTDTGIVASKKIMLVR